MSRLDCVRLWKVLESKKDSLIERLLERPFIEIFITEDRVSGQNEWQIPGFTLYDIDFTPWMNQS